MTKEVAVKGASKMPAIAGADASVLALFNGAMDNNTVEDSDVLIPKILLAQGSSKKVKEGVFNVGELVDSSNNEVLAKRTETMEAILFEPFKTWEVFRVVKDPKTGKETEEYDSVIPFDEALGREDELPDGTKIVRYICLNYHSVLTREIEAGAIKIRLLSFKSTAYKVAKAIESERKTLSTIGEGLPLCVVVWKLGVSLRENNQHSWFVPDVSKVRTITKVEADAIAPWLEMIKGAMRSNKVVYDHSDLETETSGESYETGTASEATVDF